MLKGLRGVHSRRHTGVMPWSRSCFTLDAGCEADLDFWKRRINAGKASVGYTREGKRERCK